MTKKELKINIVRANEKHLSAITRIARKQLGYTHFFDKILQDNTISVFCAVCNDKVLGYVIGKLYSNASFFKKYKKIKLAKANELKKAKKIGMLVSIAVKSKYQRKKIGSRLVRALLKKFNEHNVETTAMTAWKSKNGISMHKIASQQGFKELAEIKNYWKKDSQNHGYHCPDCGPPPCKCSCVVYALKM